MENIISRMIEDILIEYDIDDSEITFSKNNVIFKELTLDVLESPYYAGEYEIVFFDGTEEIAKIDFTGSFNDDTEAIMNKLEEIAQKILDKFNHFLINMHLNTIEIIKNDECVKILNFEINEPFINPENTEIIIFENEKEIARIKHSNSKPYYESIKNKIKEMSEKGEI